MSTIPAETTKVKKAKEPRTYNTNPTFVPTKANEISIDFIINYCEANNKIAWLQEVASKEVPPNKNGKERKISFMEIRNEFVIKFFPTIAPKAEKKLSMYDRIAALKGK